MGRAVIVVLDFEQGQIILVLALVAWIPCLNPPPSPSALLAITHHLCCCGSCLPQRACNKAISALYKGAVSACGPGLQRQYEFVGTANFFACFSPAEPR